MQRGRPPKEFRNPRRNISLTPYHDSLLTELAAKRSTTKTDIVQRGLEALEEKEAKRDKEVGGHE